MKSPEPMSQIPIAPLEKNSPGNWWTESETFAAGTFLGWNSSTPWAPWVDGLFDWGALAQSKVRFMTHCPVNKEFIDRCHAQDIRCFPYVSFYFGAAQATFGSITSPTYQGVEWAAHENWYARQSSQSDHPTPWEFGTASDGVGVTFPIIPPDPGPCVVCCNVPEYQEHMKAWVDYLMRQGADGIFVDNLGRGLQPCWGKHYGIHSHIVDDPKYPELNQTKAFALLLEQVRAVVKQYKPEGLILGNSGDPLNLPPSIQQFLDADMLELYICGPSGPNMPIVQNVLRSGQAWDEYGRQLQAYRNQGKQVLVVSQLGSARGAREDAFLCYAAARLAGFIWYGAEGPSTEPLNRDLYRVRLGKPVTDELAQGLIRYRVFEHGFAVVNLDAVNAGSLSMQAPIPTTNLYDLFPDNPAQPNIKVNPGGTIPIPACSGRIYLFGSSTDYGLNRQSQARPRVRRSMAARLSSGMPSGLVRKETGSPTDPVIAVIG